MDHIKSQLDRMNELSPDDIEALQTSIVSDFDSIEQEDLSSDNVQRMLELADALDAVRGEKSRREAESAELTSLAAEASKRVRGEEEVVEETEEALDPDADPAEGEEPAVEETEEDKAKKPPFPVKASAEDESTPVEDEDATAKFGEPDIRGTVETVEVPDDEPVVEPGTPAVEGDSDTAELAVEETPVEEITTEDEAPAEAEVEAIASETEETPNEPLAQEEAPVTAAAEGALEAPADRRPVVQVNAAPVAITAGADVPGYAAGSALDSYDSVATAMGKRIDTLRRVSGGDGEQVIVASVSTQFPEDRILGPDVNVNNKRIKEVVSPQAIMASGGFAAPLETSYDIAGYTGTDARPVRDILPRFQADRGGIRYLTAPNLLSYAGATGIWEESTDIKANPIAGPLYDDTLRKNVLLVGGVQEKEAHTYAVTLQMQFGNLMTRAFPELIARHNELALVMHARLAELTLLDRIDKESTHITAGGTIGFARDFLVTIKKAGAAYRSRHRIDGAIQLRAIIPTWIFDAIAADLTLQMPGDDVLGITRQTIQGYLAGSNITLTESFDQNSLGAQNAGALLDFPDQFTWYLFAEGSFLFLDGGTLDLGIVRDSALVGTNDYRMFSETFEGLAFVGTEALAITSTVKVNGTAAGLADVV